MIKFCKNFENVEVSKVIVEYTQEGDCCEDRDNIQVLRLETEDGGGGPFIRISTPEGHWSVSNYEDLKEIFDDFKEKVNYEDRNN